MLRKLGLLLCFLALPTYGASLPGNLTAGEVGRLTQLLVLGGATKLLRSAEGYPSWPGIRLGVELAVIPGDRVANLGNRLGAIGFVIPSPRIHLTKGIIEGVEMTIAFFPALLNTVASVGGILKWVLVTEKEKTYSLAGIVGVTGINAFQGEFQGAAMEIGAVMSKDYVRLKPFVGLSLMTGKGNIAPALTSGTLETGSMFASHLFIGTEVELPVNLTVQIDLINLDPQFSLFVGRKF